jgi:hypothetical protein
VCLENIAEFTLDNCNHIVLCDICIQPYLQVLTGEVASVNRPCPVCRARIWLTRRAQDSPPQTIVYAPGVGYTRLADLLSRTYYTPVGLFWRYYYRPQSYYRPEGEIQYYLHSTEEVGRISLQSGQPTGR